jgi:Zn-finger nucleic acid-binding protein
VYGLDRGELEKIIEQSFILSALKVQEKHPGYPDLSSKSTEEGLQI